MRNAKHPDNPAVTPPDDSGQTDSASPIGSALTMQELERVIPLTTGRFIRFQVTELGALSAEMVQAVLDSGLPLQIERLDADGAVRLIIQLTEFSGAAPMDLTLLDEADGGTAAGFFGKYAYAPLFFQTPQTLDAKMRVFLPNDGRFRKDEKMYLYVLDADRFRRTESPVAITADETMITFEVGYTDAFAVSAFRAADAMQTPGEPEKPGEPRETANRTLLIVLLCAGGAAVIGGALAAVLLIRRKKQKAAGGQ